MKKIYSATYSCNNGTTYSAMAYTDTNIARLVKAMKDIVRGNHHAERYNSSRIEIRNEDGLLLETYLLRGKRNNFTSRT